MRLVFNYLLCAYKIYRNKLQIKSSNYIVPYRLSSVKRSHNNIVVILGEYSTNCVRS